MKDAQLGINFPRTRTEGDRYTSTDILFYRRYRKTGGYAKEEAKRNVSFLKDVADWVLDINPKTVEGLIKAFSGQPRGDVPSFYEIRRMIPDILFYLSERELLPHPIWRYAELVYHREDAVFNQAGRGLFLFPEAIVSHIPDNELFNIMRPGVGFGARATNGIRSLLSRGTNTLHMLLENLDPFREGFSDKGEGLENLIVEAIEQYVNHDPDYVFDATENETQSLIQLLLTNPHAVTIRKRLEASIPFDEYLSERAIVTDRIKFTRRTDSGIGACEEVERKFCEVLHNPWSGDYKSAVIVYLGDDPLGIYKVEAGDQSFLSLRNTVNSEGIPVLIEGGVYGTYSRDGKIAYDAASRGGLKDPASGLPRIDIDRLMVEPLRFMYEKQGSHDDRRSFVRESKKVLGIP